MTVQHIVLLRHGETELSRTGVYSSRTNVPLSQSGRAAAAAWLPHTRGLPGFHSPLQRASETATLAGVNSGSLDDLSEWDLGELEGLPAEGYRQANPDWSLFRHGAPGGETPVSVQERAQRVLNRIVEVEAPAVVLVGHGQFSKMLATQLLDLPITTASRLAWGPARAAVFSWRASLSGYALAGWNRTPSPLAQLLEGNS